MTSQSTVIMTSVSNDLGSPCYFPVTIDKPVFTDFFRVPVHTRYLFYSQFNFKFYKAVINSLFFQYVLEKENVHLFYLE